MTTEIRKKTDADQPAPSGFVRHANIISQLTVLSRISGLVRDKACSYFLGVGTEWSAFWMGFQFPNLFRRIFGEGALTAVFIPVYTRVQHQQGQEAADRLARDVISLLTLVLIGLTAVGEMTVLPIALSSSVQANNRLAALMIAIMLPYSIAICLVAILGALAAAHERFAAQSLSPIINNLAMALAAAIPVWFFTGHYSPELRIKWVAAAVLASGAIQILFMLPSIWSISPVWRTGFKSGHESHSRGALQEIILTMLPMIVGLSAVQFNTFMDSQIAWWLSPDAHGGRTVFFLLGLHLHVPMGIGALGKLSVAQRIYLLPVGIFGVATATAVFPRLSRAAANGNTDEIKSLLSQALRKSSFLSIPTTLGMILISPLLISVIYLGGSVTPEDVARSAWAARWFCAGIWAFETQMILIRVFYAQRDTRTPMKIAAYMVLLNIALNLTLVWFMQEGGIAAATTISAIIQCIILLAILKKRSGNLGLSPLRSFLIRALFAGMLMCVAGWSIDSLLSHIPLLDTSHRVLAALVRLPIVVLVCALMYGVAARVMSIPELSEAPVLKFLARRGTEQ
jgi:putative peptidoglycan lipid II flippase